MGKRSFDRLKLAGSISLILIVSLGFWEVAPDLTKGSNFIILLFYKEKPHRFSIKADFNNTNEGYQ